MSQGAPLAVAGPASDGPVDYVRRHPGLVLIALLLGTGLTLGVAEGWRELAQVTINGLVSGSYFALGAAGLTLVYGVLKLVNFAHGEYLTFGAYMAIFVAVRVRLAARVSARRSRSSRRPRSRSSSSS